MFLGEGLKNVLLEILSNADSGVLDDKPAVCRSILEGGLLRPDKDGAMGPIVSQRVVDDIRQNLLQMQGIPDDSAVPQPGILQLQADSPLLRQRGENRDAVLQRVMKVKGLLHRRRPSALQLADLEDIVHQGQQMLR